MQKIHLIATFSLLAMTANAQFSNSGTLKITSGTTLTVLGAFSNASTGTITNDGAIEVKGNITNDATMSAANAGSLNFNGTSAQSLNGTNTYFAKNVVINNSAGVTINQKLEIDGAITFTDGIVTAASSTNPVTFTENASISGTPSDASHIDGYVVKMGTGSFSYPVGDATSYQKVDVDLDANATGLQVKYNAADAGSGTYATTGTETTALNAYNSLENWDITPASTASGKVTIYWDAYNNTGITSISTLKVAHKVGSEWLNEGGTATGTVSAGSVQSNTISSWSPLTLGSTADNPLPVRWVSVRAELNSNNQAVTKWKVIEEQVSHYTVEKSANGNLFYEIGMINSIGNGENNYSFTDELPVNNNTYYRIKQTDVDGSITYSRTQTIFKQRDANRLLAYPNPVTNGQLNIELTEPGTVTLFDNSGKRLFLKQYPMGVHTINLNQYAKGIYHITADNTAQSIVIP